MSSYLDALLSSNSTSGSADVVAQRAPSAVTAPAAGARLFFDSDNGIVARLADNTLQLIYGHARTLDVANFIPPGDAFLTTSNFDYAIRAALAVAQALDGATKLIVPAGKWPMSAAPLHLIGRGSANPIPLIEGQGRGCSELIWPDSYTGVCVFVDGWQGGSGPLAYYGGLCRISIRAEGQGKGCGIKVVQGIWTLFNEVLVGEFLHYQNKGVSTGLGVWVDGNRGTGPTRSENSQNIVFSNCLFMHCTVGARLRACGPALFHNCEWNQNGWRDVIYDGGNDIVISAKAMMQSAGGLPSGAPYHGNPVYACDEIGIPVPSQTGTGATLSAPSGGLVTVGGLTGMSATLSRQQYLDLDHPGFPENTGQYRITQVLGASSVVIEKAGGSSATGVTWTEYRNGGGNAIHYGPFVYHEGTIVAMQRTTETHAVDVDSGSACQFHFDGMRPSNCDYIVDAYATGRITIINTRGSAMVAPIRARLCGSIIAQEIDPSTCDLDDFSLQAFIGYGGGAGKGGSFYAGQRPQGKTINSLLAAKAADIFDPGVAASLSFSGANVHTVTGAVHGSTATAVGGDALYIAAHADMGGQPALGLRKAGSGRTFHGTFATPIAVGKMPGMFFVMLPPKGYSSGTGGKRGPSMFGASDNLISAYDSGDGSDLVGFIGGGGYAFSGIGGHYTGTGPIIGLMQRRHDLASLTNYPTTIIGDGKFGQGSSNSQPYQDHKLVATVTDFLFCGELPDGGAANDLDVAYVAYLHTPLSAGEVADLFAMAYERWGTRRGRSVLATISSTPASALDGLTLNGAIVPLDVSGGNITVPLPSGHQRGDSVRFKLIGSSGGHTATLDPDGAQTVDGSATYVMSGDGARIELVSDGSNWLAF